MGYLDYTDAWVIALTRQRRAEARREAERAPTLRFNVADAPKQQRDRAAMRAWRAGQWRTGNRRCGYCGCKLTLRQGEPNQATVDHREPWRSGFGGHDCAFNWLMACFRCNNRKGAMPEAEFRALLAAD